MMLHNVTNCHQGTRIASWLAIDSWKAAWDKIQKAVHTIHYFKKKIRNADLRAQIVQDLQQGAGPAISVTFPALAWDLAELGSGTYSSLVFS